MDWLHQHKGIAIQRGCGLLGLARSSYYAAGGPDAEADQPVRDALNELVGRHPRWGFWKCYRRMRALGQGWNHKRVWRVYCAMRLNLPRRCKKRIGPREPQKLEVPARANVVWAMDFMQDTLVCGMRFRILNILDEGVREGLAIVVDTSLPAERVVRQLEQLKSARPLPAQIRVDNGPELISGRLQLWCERNGVRLHHIQPGKPAQNAFIERFNRSFRNEILDAHIFTRLSEVQQMAEEWLFIYNHERPHAALGHRTPAAFASQCATPSPGRQGGRTNELFLPPANEDVGGAVCLPRFPSRCRSGINGCLPADAGPLHLFRSDLDEVPGVPSPN